MRNLNMTGTSPLSTLVNFYSIFFHKLEERQLSRW